MNRKHQQNISHANLNKYLMVENKIQITSGITINVAVRTKIRKKHVCDKNHIWNSNKCTFENGKYLGSIIADSGIMSDATIKVTKATPTKTVPAKTTPIQTISTNFNKQKVTCKLKKSYILISFLLISISLLIALSIYYCFMKY